MALRHHMRVAAVAATAACAAAACSFGGNGPIVTSGDLSGETTTEARQVDGFTEVAVGGGAELTVTEGDTYSVEVTTDSGLQQHVTTSVDGQRLVIEQEYSMIGDAPRVQVVVTLPDLHVLDVSGAATAQASGVDGDELTVRASGASRVDVAAQARELTLDVSGSAFVTGAGESEHAIISLSGSAELNGDALTATTASLSVSGTASASVHVIDSLDANASGTGSITYYGAPHLSQEVSGAGHVQAGAEQRQGASAGAAVRH